MRTSWFVQILPVLQKSVVGPPELNFLPLLPVLAEQHLLPLMSLRIYWGINLA